jgi:hypothetical protein
MLLLFFGVLCIPFCSMNAIDASKNINGRDVPCVGVMDTEDPNYTYELSIWNVSMGVLASGLAFIPPIYVVAKRLQCPTSQKSLRPDRTLPIPPTSVSSQPHQVIPANTP